MLFSLLCDLHQFPLPQLIAVHVKPGDNKRGQTQAASNINRLVVIRSNNVSILPHADNNHRQNSVQLEEVNVTLKGHYVVLEKKVKLRTEILMK